MSTSTNSTHIAVIGGGPGGYAAAFKAADLGMKVTLINSEPNPGGVCLYRGCIPSKALLHVAKLINETKEALDCGIKFGKPKINLIQLRRWTTDVVQKLTGGLGQLCQARQINYIQGQAHFENSHRLKITHDDNREERMEIDYSIIATGSTPRKIPGLSPESEYIMDSTDALKLQSIPATLLVIGGGYIGLELGTVYHALGTKVTVVEMTSGLLPGVDRDLVSILEKQLRNRSLSVRLNTKVVAMKELDSTIEVQFVENDHTLPKEKFEKVLVAVGRIPNSKGVGLENTKVEVDENGFIKVNEQRRTTDSVIFAIGDVVGEPMLAHKATHEGIVVAEAIDGVKTSFTPQAIPAVVFTDPEIAWCGLTEIQAQQGNVPVMVSKFPWAASGRAKTLAHSHGITKLLIDRESERILGVGICGNNAGELIAEGALAIEMAALATDIKLTIHPHPTLSETIMESAELFSGASTHVLRPAKRKKS